MGVAIVAAPKQLRSARQVALLLASQATRRRVGAEEILLRLAGGEQVEIRTLSRSAPTAASAPIATPATRVPTTNAAIARVEPRLSVTGRLRSRWKWMPRVSSVSWGTGVSTGGAVADSANSAAA
jgi:hypothetical protein